MATGGRHGDGRLLVINKVNQTDVLGIELLSWSTSILSEQGIRERSRVRMRHEHRATVCSRLIGKSH